MDILKISRLIAGGLLLLAIASLPYGYYQFLRIAITIIAGINAYTVFENNNKILFIVYFVIAILFNPIIPIHLNKDIWTPIDLITGIFFFVVAFKKSKDKGDYDYA